MLKHDDNCCCEKKHDNEDWCEFWCEYWCEKKRTDRCDCK